MKEKSLNEIVNNFKEQSNRLHSSKDSFIAPKKGKKGILDIIQGTKEEMEAKKAFKPSKTNETVSSAIIAEKLPLPPTLGRCPKKQKKIT